MKKSLLHLPRDNREDLKAIVKYVLEEGDYCEMIILYGSYARGDYVEYDQRVEFGVCTSFMSDYDILVITKDKKILDLGHFAVGRKLERAAERYYKRVHRGLIPTVNFIDDTIDFVNKAIDKGYSFYTTIKKEGIVLYDSGNCKLARRRKPNFREIKELAEMYFKENFERAESFLEGVKFYRGRNDYRLASFLFHQVCENLYRAVILTYTLDAGKEHNLIKLSASAKSQSLETSAPFPRDTAEEKRLFELLVKAYVQARYNPKFLVTKEDIEALIPRVELLRDITEHVCDAKIAEYDRRARA